MTNDFGMARLEDFSIPIQFPVMLKIEDLLQKKQ